MSEMKCPNCGKIVPENAHFCPFCETVLAKKTEIAELKVVPRKVKKRIIIAAAVVLLLAVSAVIVVNILARRPSAEASYNYQGTTYHLVLRNSLDFNHLDSPQELAEKRIQAENAGAIPMQLYVHNAETGENAKEEFEELLEDVRVSVNVLSGTEAAELGTPVDHPGFPEALRETDVIINGNVRENRIDWTLTMKDGKKISLSGRVLVTALPTVTYDYRKMSLNTMEEVQALVREIESGGHEDSVVTINLGPWTYSGDLEISSHAVNLTGTEDNGAKTVIEGTVYAGSKEPFAGEIMNIVFEGGSGAGVVDRCGTFVTSCEFNGLDNGIYVPNNGYAMPSGCTFRNCRVGFYFSSMDSLTKRPLFDGNIFTGNQTAVLLENVPGDDILMFDGCVFEGNGTDIDNRTGHELDLRGAEMKEE